MIDLGTNQCARVEKIAKNVQAQFPDERLELIERYTADFLGSNAGDSASDLIAELLPLNPLRTEVKDAVHKEHKKLFDTVH